MYVTMLGIYLAMVLVPIFPQNLVYFYLDNLGIIKEKKLLIFLINL